MGCQLVAAALFFLQSGAKAGAGNIRLRNELIESGSGTNRAVMAATMHARVAASGLFLIQFSGPLEPARRAELRRAGVELLQYVPEDAFIAKFNNVSAANIGALNYVSWIGPYRKELKINPRLAKVAPIAGLTNGTVNINILLSPSATAAEIAAVRSHLAVVHDESRLRQGIIVRGELLPGQLDALSQSDAVLWIEPAPHRKLIDEAASKIVGGDDGRWQRGRSPNNAVSAARGHGLRCGHGAGFRRHQQYSPGLGRARDGFSVFIRR